MRFPGLSAGQVGGFLTVVTLVSCSGADAATYRIECSRRAVTAGETVDLRLAPPAPPTSRVVWGVASGSSGTNRVGLFGPAYRAPFVIPPGTPAVTVIAAIQEAGGTTTATTEIELVPGAMPGAEDCLGSGQQFSTKVGDLEKPFVMVTDGGELVTKVEPIYPRSATARGIEDKIPVRALVCRSGHVLSVFVPPSFTNPTDPQPIQHDPKLVDAALTAVRQYVFSPAMSSGQPVAFWAEVIVTFKL